VPGCRSDRERKYRFTSIRLHAFSTVPQNGALPPTVTPIAGSTSTRAEHENQRVMVRPNVGAG
jgi:hypothetical protein